MNICFIDTVSNETRSFELHVQAEKENLRRQYMYTELTFIRTSVTFFTIAYSRALTATDKAINKHARVHPKQSHGFC